MKFSDELENIIAHGGSRKNLTHADRGEGGVHKNLTFADGGGGGGPKWPKKC